MSSVIRILKACAPKNAYNGFRFEALNKSENRVSRPMLVKASTNQRVSMLFNPFLTGSIASGLNIKENTKEAARKPRTNFGKRSQSNPRVGLLTSAPSGALRVYVQ